MGTPTGRSGITTIVNGARLRALHWSRGAGGRKAGARRAGRGDVTSNNAAHTRPNRKDNIMRSPDPPALSTQLYRL